MLPDGPNQLEMKQSRSDEAGTKKFQMALEKRKKVKLRLKLGADGNSYGINDDFFLMIVSLHVLLL